jgi:hypothetical protein
MRGEKQSKKIRSAGKRKSIVATVIDATIERIAQAGNDNTGFVNGKIERAGERVPIVRRFRDATIDRMLRAKRISAAQHYAADWYRGIYEEAGITHRVTANYGGTGHGEATYGMPTTERQARCRRKLRDAREVLGMQMVGLIDNLVLHDLAPALGNSRQRERYAAMIGRALQPLADWLAAPVHE